MKTIAALLGAAIIFCAASAASAAGTLSVFIWSEYMDPEIINNFEKQYDIKVRLDYYESNEEMIIKLDKGGGLGKYDIVVPSTYFVPSLTNLNLLEELDHSRIPNLANLAPDFNNLPADPGNKYTVPYQWGTSGVIIRAGDIDKMPKSWRLIYDPAIKESRFIMLDNARDVIGSALKYLGYSINSTNPQEIEAAARLVISTKKRPTFLGFDGAVGAQSKVLGGFATVAQTYSGEGVRANDEDPEIHYILPAEGGEIWTDLLAIPRKAPNQDNAYKFINYILEGQVGARLATYNRCATPNAAALEFIPEEDLKNPAIYPDVETLNKLEYLEDLGAGNRLYDEAWTLIKTQ